MAGLGKINISDLQDSYGKLSEENAKISGSIYKDYDYGKSNLIQAANGHYSDSGKLPWHPTFSTESAYSTPEFKGGEWKEIDGKMTYTPSEDMIKAGTTKGLVEYMRTREPDVELRTPYGYVIDNDNIRMQKANELIGYDESKYNKNPSLELQRIYELNKLKQNDKPLKDATGQFIPAAKVLHTKEINYALKGPSQSVITENGIQKLGNEILDKSGYGLSLNELNDITTKTNGLGTIDMKDMQLNTKTFDGIRL